MGNSSCVAPIPLPPKKHQRSSSGSREPRESAVSASYNANKCEDHEYDEYCPGAYESQTPHHQSSRQSHLSSSSSTKHQQRSATFDVADARDYELKRLGNRRSQSQNATNLKQARNGGLVVSGDHHRGERTHDRERSRSDHRISSYACDDTSLAMTHGYSGNVGNGGVTHHHSHHQQQMQQQQQQHRQQQRREKTFKV